MKFYFDQTPPGKDRSILGGFETSQLAELSRAELVKDFPDDSVSAIYHESDDYQHCATPHVIMILATSDGDVEIFDR